MRILLVSQMYPGPEDPDLGVLATSFNDMASALQLRVERDARFASDVSHELRSPLMTLSASVDVMEARREEMPERAQAALDKSGSSLALGLFNTAPARSHQAAPSLCATLIPV